MTSSKRCRSLLKGARPPETPGRECAAASPNTGGCIFYLTLQPIPAENDRRTVFGRVIEGLGRVRTLEKDDEIVAMRVRRKGDHEYVPEKISTDEPPTDDSAGVKFRLNPGNE